MSLASDLQGAADLLIKDFGNSATFKDIVTEPYTPSTGEAVVTTTDITIKVGGPFGMNPSMVDGDTVRTGDAEIIIAAKDVTFTPTTTERVVIFGETWTIVAVKPFTTQDSTIAWKCQVRK